MCVDQADEMGMGKTAVCIALVLASRRRKKEKDGSTVKATLIVSDTTLTQQWLNEIKKMAPSKNIKTY
jgi:SNF2 family DNA or RNA helicase